MHRASGCIVTFDAIAGERAWAAWSKSRVEARFARDSGTDPRASHCSSAGDFPAGAAFLLSDKRANLLIA